MNWVKSRKLPVIEAIKHNSRPCLTSENLWNSLYSSFNTALHQQVNLNILDEVDRKPPQKWSPFFRFEFKLAISKCNDSSTLGSNKLT